MRVLMTGGGTAGHVNPAIAIADIIRQHDRDAVIEFVGVRGKKEEDLVPREGYRLHFVRAMGIQRSLTPSNIKAVYLAVTSPYAQETKKILDDFRPDLVIGTGGYASWPILAAATARKIPTAIHESNAIPGLTVKVLARRVDEVWLNFASAEKLLKTGKPVFSVGNPLRKNFGGLTRSEAREQLGISQDRKILLSFGGSLGAENVNDAVLELMKTYTAKHPEVLHVHASGKRDFADSMKAFKESGLDAHDNCILVEYIYNMSLRMAAADVVISRAGAMTLSELAMMKKPVILIPSPYVADNHQYKNAKTLSDAGAAILIQEKELTGKRLEEAVESLLSSEKTREEMATRLHSFAKSDANEKIWERIQFLTKGKGNSL